MEAPEARLTDVDYLEVQCKSALNPVKGMGFAWSLNPYTGCEHRCAFCYVRAFERRADRPSDDRYVRSIRVKINVAGVLRSELSRRSWRKETVVIGAATDPYQPAEGRYKLTRQCLQALSDFSNPAAMITRGPMIVRDLDVLSELARRANLHITFSIPTVDDDIWRRTEPGTAHPRQRLRAIEKLVAAGIDVGVGMAPIIPGLSDRPDRLEAVVKAARAAGATGLWAGHAPPQRRNSRALHVGAGKALAGAGPTLRTGLSRARVPSAVIQRADDESGGAATRAPRRLRSAPDHPEASARARATVPSELGFPA